MKFLKTFNRYLLFAFPVIFFLSCSGSRTEIENVDSDFYFSPKYENRRFNDATIGIIMVDLSLDTLSSRDLEEANPKMLDFGKTFTEYFPIGIKKFSTIKKVDWIYYTVEPFSERIEYKLNSPFGNEIDISLPYSLNYFNSKINTDFVLFIKFLSIQYDPEEIAQTEIEGRKYEMKFIMEYYIWDNNNLEFISIDKTKTSSEFDKLPEIGLFRNIILKMAFKIFQKLAMFQK
jgi:hypothetical protein